MLCTNNSWLKIYEVVWQWGSVLYLPVSVVHAAKARYRWCHSLTHIFSFQNSDRLIVRTCWSLWDQKALWAMLKLLLRYMSAKLVTHSCRWVCTCPERNTRHRHFSFHCLAITGLAQNLWTHWLTGWHVVIRIWELQVIAPSRGVWQSKTAQHRHLFVSGWKTLYIWQYTLALTHSPTHSLTLLSSIGGWYSSSLHQLAAEPQSPLQSILSKCWVQIHTRFNWEEISCKQCDR